MFMQNLYKLSEYYELIIDFKMDMKTEIKFLDKIFSKYKIKTILDVACGVGRHSVELAKLNYNVTGIDYSNNQLDQARKKAKISGVKVKFMKRDANKLDLNDKYDTVICMWTTLSEEPLKYKDVISGVRNSLKDNGLFIIDNRSWEQIPDKKEEKFTNTIQKDSLKITVQLYDRYTENFRIRDATYTINGKKIHDLCITHLLKEKDWINVLEENGFKIVEIYYDYKKQKIKKPERVQIVAKKV